MSAAGSALRRGGSTSPSTTGSSSPSTTAAIMEIIRYSFFAMKEAFGSAPSWLSWLSSFMLFYPTGISSEVGLIYMALRYMKVSLSLLDRPPFFFLFASVPYKKKENEHHLGSWIAKDPIANRNKKKFPFAGSLLPSCPRIYGHRF
ncbi:Very-long-chain (3R)-3-hydroxyacyl-CoA dehydratase PASTICCINO 2A [Zea mays]|uniref:Very-long-chain (3R)-3-hydroxyacyl-CoA dehydratase n=1 Tax=Zea mays TaxID=4577 RepID=A0A3L6DLI7_MAIZE|nr:Very-long-chain (3R)-3-hydroxyacyl-CoA dehydratase PASTICCINO 2A [Zea mays]